ncbi:MAG: rane protein [Gammaproteobacteria bacterium]|jgi:integrating conjugative element protein (TIGR03752 family)|nr:rane protein [Gammaproteobacteria bacterium]
MMPLLKNPRMLIAVIGVTVLILFGLTRCHQKPSETSDTASIRITGDTASGDTNIEVLRQLSAQLKVVKSQNEQNQKVLKDLTDKNNTLSVKDINNLRHQLETTLHENEAKMQSLNAAIDEIKSAQGELTQSLQRGTEAEDNRLTGITAEKTGTITKVTDLQNRLATPVENNKQAKRVDNTLSSPTEKQKTGFSNAMDSTYQPIQTKPANLHSLYTIPAISNLANTSLLTALIGEVPNDGQLVQPPFPFEAITGRKDLIAANGIDLPPEIEGMKVYGYSLGVGSFLDNLSCVRAYITKVLFVFDDGHYLVFGNEDNPTTSVNTNDSLGYLTDLYGNPCIPGEFITNAPQVLATLVAAGTVSASADALAEAQTTTFTDSTSSSMVVSGNMAKYAIGSGVADSMNKTVDWILNRVKGTFDVVYLAASQNGKPTKLVINFTKTIPIDEDSNGRQLRFAKQPDSAGGMANLTIGDKAHDTFD